MILNKKDSEILIVDSDPVNMDVLVELLNEYDVETRTDGYSALESIEKHKPDLILLDINTQKLNGFELCKRLKSTKQTQDIPIIFLSSEYNGDSLVHAFGIGGADYIVKPYHVEEVLVRIQTQLKLKKSLEILEQRSKFDELTGMPNRKKFFLDTKKLIKSAQAGIPIHLFMFSIENFDMINGEFGYVAGDEIIKAVPQIIKKVLKTEYTLYRLEGTHFTLLFSPSEEIDDAIEWAYAIQKASERTRFKAYKGLSFKLKYRYATSNQEDTSIHQIMQRAHNSNFK